LLLVGQAGASSSSRPTSYSLVNAPEDNPQEKRLAFTREKWL
jgi:hypothetical protein